MAKHSRLQVLNIILETGLVPLFYHDDPEVAVKVIQACLDGGARSIEFTNRGDDASTVFTEIYKHFKKDPHLVLGAGTITDPATAAFYLQMGVNFIIGPTFHPEIARLCNRRMIPYIPGCATTTEISNAQEMGSEICKVFPGGEIGGPDFIRAVLGPLPWSRLMPTGGVEPEKESIQAWIKAGAACLGMGSRLISTRVVAAGDFQAIKKNVQQVLTWIKEARSC